jgi:C4-dicarboxylate transporter, DctM subunit
MVALVVLLAFALLAVGAPIFSVFLAVAAWGATVTARGTMWEDFGGQMQNVATLGTGEPATVLSTIPLFIFAGFLMAESKTADRMVRVARAGIGWLPGGLAVVTIFACALFTTFTGASGVTIVALGALLMPSLLKERYPERFSLGLVAGTGSVGLLFPPALPLFVYGTVYGLVAQTMTDSGQGEMQLIEFSTDRFILAGVVPGLVLLAILTVYAVAVAAKRGVPRHPFSAAEFGNSLAVALPELAIPFLIIAALVQGVGIPEVASLCVVYVLFLEVAVYRDLQLRALWRVVRESMALVGAIFIIIFAAQAVTNFLVTAEVPMKLVAWIVDTFDSQWTFLLGLNLLLLVVGMLMDIFSAIVIVVPLIAPAAARMGIDPFHLGVIFLLNLEIGYLTPPVGLNLFITGFTFRKPILDVVRASVPFLACMIVALALITYVPALTVVPEKERRGRASVLARDVHVAYQQASAVKEVALPDGTVKKLAECEAVTDLMRKEVCKALFTDVTECRNKAAGRVGSPCEVKAIEEYLKLSEDEGSDDSDEWNLDEEGEGEAAEDGDAGSGGDEDGGGEAGPGSGGSTPKKAGGTPE